MLKLYMFFTDGEGVNRKAYTVAENSESAEKYAKTFCKVRALSFRGLWPRVTEIKSGLTMSTDIQDDTHYYLT
jgi:hypothetical protein